jgi:hypothetical protein
MRGAGAGVSPVRGTHGLNLTPKPLSAATVGAFGSAELRLEVSPSEGGGCMITRCGRELPATRGRMQASAHKASGANPRRQVTWLSAPESLTARRAPRPTPSPEAMRAGSCNAGCSTPKGTVHWASVRTCRPGSSSVRGALPPFPPVGRRCIARCEVLRCLPVDRSPLLAGGDPGQAT